jgi:Transposase DDE domain
VRHRQLQRPRGLGGVDTGPNPTDRGKNGSKHHLLVDRTGIPLSGRVSAANVPDVTMLLATVVACPLTGYGEAGKLPEELYADRAYDADTHEGLLEWLGIEPVFAQRGQPHGSGLGKHRDVVEQTIAAVHQNRRLKVRYEKRSDIHQAFLTLACIKICGYRLDTERD